MDTPKHINAPWKFDGNSVVDAQGKCACTKTNGPLIAAAPELLAALRQLESTIRIHGTTPARGIPLENARRAIASAGVDLL